METGFITGLFQLHTILISTPSYYLHHVTNQTFQPLGTTLPFYYRPKSKVLPDKTMAKGCENSGEVGRFMMIMNIQPKTGLQTNTTSASIKSNKVCMPSGLFFRYWNMIKEQKLKTNPTKNDKRGNRTILPQLSFSQQAFLLWMLFLQVFHKTTELTLFFNKPKPKYKIETGHQNLRLG